MKKERWWFAAVLLGIAVFVIWYAHSPGYYHNRVMTPTLSSYYLQLESVSSYRDAEKFINRIKVEPLDVKTDQNHRDVTIMVHVIMNDSFTRLGKEQADERLVKMAADLRLLNERAREDAGVPEAEKKCEEKGKITVTDTFQLYCQTKDGEFMFPRD